MLSRLKLIGAKTEATQGDPATIGETDFFHAWDIDIKPVAELLDRPYNSASLDTFAQLPGRKWYEAKFKTYLKASGSKGVAPAMGRLLQAAGFSETPVADTSVTYAPVSAPVANFFTLGKSCTIKVYENGILHIMAGAVAKLKLTIEAGKPIVCEWDVLAPYISAVGDAGFPANTPDSTDPPIVKSGTFVLQAYAATISKLEIDLGNDVAEKLDVNAANSILGYQITGRKPVGSADPDAVVVNTHDFYGKMISGAQASTSIVVGTGAGNIITITLPKTQYGLLGAADANGVMKFQIPLIFNRNAGDDWISIVMT